MINPMLQASILLFLAVMFGLALVHKIRDFRGFILILNSYFDAIPFLHKTFIFLLALVVIAWEVSILIAALLALFLPSAIPVAGFLSAVLLTVYAAAIAANILRGNVLLDCGCSWGEGKAPVSFLLVGRDMILASLSLLVLLPVSPHLFNAFEAVNIFFLSLVGYLLYVIADQMILNQSLKQELP